MDQRKLLLFQTLLEAVIPVVGYLFWDWDVTFILLFYLLDWLLFLSLTIAKSTKRLNYSRRRDEKRLAIKEVSVGFFLCILTCGVIFFTLLKLIPGLSWEERIVSFLTYTDMGIQQGIILIPLIVLFGWMQYKQQFLLPARYRTQTMQTIARPAVQQGIILLITALIFLLISLFVSYPTEIIIGVVVIGTSVYRWRVTRNG